MEEAFQDAEKRYGAVPFRIIQRLVWFWKCDDLGLAPYFGDLGCVEVDGEEDSGAIRWLCRPGVG